MSSYPPQVYFSGVNIDAPPIVSIDHAATRINVLFIGGQPGSGGGGGISIIGPTTPVTGFTAGSFLTTDGSYVTELALPLIIDGNGGGSGGGSGGGGTSYTLPIATSSVLGGVKIGSGVSVALDGTISVSGGGSGSVTSVAVTGANGISVTGSPITSTGTIALSLGAITPASVNGVTIAGSGTPALTVTGTTSVSGSNTGDQDLSSYAKTATVASSYQPLDSDLTSIAALTTTTFGRSLLTQADAAATRTTLGLGSLATQNTVTTITGNAGTATALQTARTINGVSFDGTANITVAASAATLTGTLATTAMPALTGDVTSTAGSLTTTLAATGVTAGSYTNADITVDAKGRITAVANGAGGGGGGSGTVTSVSVTTANGVSGTVATSTTTPAITLTLGAIAPSSVNGVVLSGSSTPTLAVTGTAAISGTNTGDQNLSAYATTAAVAAAYQPLDSDLTAIAALTTTTFGRSLLTQADASATRTTLGLGSLATASAAPAGTLTGTLATSAMPALTGDITNTSGSLATTLAASGVTSGSYTFSNITVDSKGRVTAASSGVKAISTLTDGATITVDLSVSLRFVLASIAGNRTVVFSNDADGTQFWVDVTQDATGGRTITWPSGIKWMGGATGTPLATASKTTQFAFVRISSGVYRGFQVNES